MSLVAEHKLSLTDEKIEELLQIPEIRRAVDRYSEIQSEYRDAIVREVKLSPDELPDVSNIRRRYDAMLEEHKTAIRRLVTKYA